MQYPTVLKKVKSDPGYTFGIGRTPKFNLLKQVTLAHAYQVLLTSIMIMSYWFNGTMTQKCS